jgi:hypothetical protein
MGIPLTGLLRISPRLLLVCSVVPGCSFGWIDLPNLAGEGDWLPAGRIGPIDNEGGSAVVERTDSGKGTALSPLSNYPMELPLLLVPQRRTATITHDRTASS